MKKIFVLLAAIMLLPAFALAQIQMDFANENGSQLVVFSAQADMPQAAPGKNAPADPVLMALCTGAGEEGRRACRRTGKAGRRRLSGRKDCVYVAYMAGRAGGRTRGQLRRGADGESGNRHGNLPGRAVF